MMHGDRVRTVVLAALMLCAQTAASAATTDLFSLPYDFGEANFNVYKGSLGQRAEKNSPALMLLQVDPGGRVWLSTKPFEVRQFSRGGEFLRTVDDGPRMRTDAPHEPHRLPEGFRGLPWQFVSAMTGFAASPEGLSIMLCEPDARPVVFDGLGQMLTSQIDMMTNTRTELRGEEKLVYQLRRRMDEVWPEITDVRWDAGGNLYLAIGNAGSVADGWDGPVLAKFGPGLEWIGWRRGSHVAPDGTTFLLQATAQRAPLTQLLRFGPDGEALPPLELVPDAEEAGNDFDPVRGWPPPQHLAMDGHGSIYLVYWRSAADTGKTCLGIDMSALDVDVRVHGFDAEGNWRRTMAAASVAGTALGPPIAVGPRGNVYCGFLDEDAFRLQMISFSGARD